MSTADADVTVPDTPARGRRVTLAHRARPRRGELTTGELTTGRVARVGDIEVRRLLPLRRRRSVGAWCFVDHYGPTSVDGVAGMQVPRTRTSACRPSPGCWTGTCCTATAWAVSR